MGVVVSLLLDAQANRNVVRLWNRLDEIGCDVSLQRRDQPHLTLLSADDGDPESVGRALVDLDLAPAPRVMFGWLGYFRDPGGVLFLAATPTAELLECHARVWHAVTGVAPHQRPFCQPGTWTPHITLALGVTELELGEAVAAISGLPTIFETAVTAIRAHSWQSPAVWQHEIGPVVDLDGPPLPAGVAL